MIHDREAAERGRYVQTCAHKARLLNAVHDLERYRRQSSDWWKSAHAATNEGLLLATRARTLRAAWKWDPELADPSEITALEHDADVCESEASDYRKEATLADARAEDALALVLQLRGVTTCLVCGDTGVVVGNGSALTGGPARRVGQYGLA